MTSYSDEPLPSQVTLERTSESLSLTLVDFVLALPPDVDELTLELLRAAVVAWGLLGETREYMPESFDIPTFQDEGRGGTLSWGTSTEQFGDASLSALVDWLRRALNVGSLYSHRDLSVTVRVSV